ncbi:MAG: hypothetical protein RL169_468 [Armatimonadota bacterium]
MSAHALRRFACFLIMGFTACSVTAVTKTTGIITNPRRVAGSRNRGNEMFCLVNVWLTPPAFTKHAAPHPACLPNGMFGSNSSVYVRTAVSACPYTETANRALPVMGVPIILNAHLYRVTFIWHSIVCLD